MKKKMSQSNLLYYLFLVFFLFSAYSCMEKPQDRELFGEHIKSNIQALSSDEFEGRGPATPGGQKTVEYIESKFKKIGLKPAANGSYRQPVPLLEITGSEFSDLEISSNGNILHAFEYGEDMMINSNLREKEITIEGSELVFAGYGIVAPEYNWNDYEDIDVEGKTVVVLVNDPGFATRDEELFTGNAMTYYGRWTYKYEEAARQGAEAVLIVHQDEPAGYGWDVVRNSWSGVQYRAADGDDDYLKAEGWIHLDAAKDLFADAGTTLENAMDKAKQPGFKAESLNLSASASFNNSFEQLESFNVAGYIEGSEHPEETVIYMAHWDHLGKDKKDGEEIIYNGAIDNATGVAGLIAIGERFAGLEEPPERSVVFLAVTAEESGLIGSQHYAENPLFPIAKTVAAVNMDALNVYGTTRDVEVVGYSFSELDDYLKKHAEKQNREVVPNDNPEVGSYYRSDHFNLARKGVPAIYASGGEEYIGQDEAYAEKVRQDSRSRYHQPSDTIHDLWRYDGIYQDLRLFFTIGNELANSDDFPGWTQDNEFKNIREQTADKRQR